MKSGVCVAANPGIVRMHASNPIQGWQDFNNLPRNHSPSFNPCRKKNIPNSC